MSQTVVGIFEHADQAQEAKTYLIANGFSSENIDINTIAGSNYGDNKAHDEDTGIGERISHFFSSLFDDEDEVHSHSEAARHGTTVTVHTTTESQTSEAVQVLDNFGAVDVNDFAQSGRRAGASAGSIGSYDSPDAFDRTEALGGNEPLDTDLVNISILDTDIFANDTAGTERLDPLLEDDDRIESNSGVIPIIEEELQVHKQEVETGGVRMRSRIVDRPVQENIRLRTEHVNVERTSVNRPATEEDFAAFKEGTVELTEHTEVPVVNKDARVVEEVRLNKAVTETEQTISDTVRRTEVDIEDLDDKTKNI